MSPLFILFMLQDEPYYRIISFFLVLFISLTDALDGYYARAHNLISDLGKYLDPIADKIFILSVLITFHFILEDYFPFWMLSLIILRDISVTLLRNIFQKEGLNFETSRLAKNKTLIQIISIHIIILLIILNDYSLFYINYSIFYYIMLFCTFLTVISGFSYYYQYYLLKINERN